MEDLNRRNIMVYSTLGCTVMIFYAKSAVSSLDRRLIVESYVCGGVTKIVATRPVLVNIFAHNIKKNRIFN
jgi:hypothetical protein